MRNPLPGAQRPAGGRSGSEINAELRRDRRARASWPARLLDKSGRIIQVTVCDVSEGGVGLLGPGPLPIGTVLNVSLSVPGAAEAGRMQAVTASVRVVFSSFVGTRCRLGVQFVDLPMPARIVIRSFVNANG